jgi:hypothetical protein
MIDRPAPAATNAHNDNFFDNFIRVYVTRIAFLSVGNRCGNRQRRDKNWYQKWSQSRSSQTDNQQEFARYRDCIVETRRGRGRQFMPGPDKLAEPVWTPQARKARPSEAANQSFSP